MMKGDADGDVALHRHAGQVQRSIFSGEESNKDYSATDKDLYLVEDVADDEKCNSQRHLDHVVDHQVEEQDVTGICVEDLKGQKKSTCDRGTGFLISNESGVGIML